jgi:hypothetical protein
MARKKKPQELKTPKPKKRPRRTITFENIYEPDIDRQVEALLIILRATTLSKKAA